MGVGRSQTGLTPILSSKSLISLSFDFSLHPPPASALQRRNTAGVRRPAPFHCLLLTSLSSLADSPSLSSLPSSSLGLAVSFLARTGSRLATARVSVGSSRATTLFTSLRVGPVVWCAVAVRGSSRVSPAASPGVMGSPSPVSRYRGSHRLVWKPRDLPPLARTRCCRRPKLAGGVSLSGKS